MAVNRELNNKVAELFHNLLTNHVVNSQADFCKRIDLDPPSFAHVLANKRSFPKTKIPVLTRVFDLEENFFKETKYSGEDDINSKIIYIMTAVDMNQKEFAKRLGVSQQTISAIKTRTNTNPTFNLIWGLVNVFKVNPYFLLSKDQIVFDSGKKFSNRAKVDNMMSLAKKILEEGSKISF